LRSAGDTDLRIDGPSNFSGTVDIDSGALVLASTHTVTGSIDMAAGTTLDIWGDVSMTAASQLTGAGGLTCNVGTSSIAGGYSLSGPVSINGGVLTFSINPVALPSYSQSGGRLNIAGDVTVTGSMTWSGGEIGGGTITAADGITLSDDTVKHLRDGTTVIAAAGSTWSAGTLRASEGSIFRIPIGATLDVTGDVRWHPFIGPLPTFDIDGTLLRSAGSGDLEFGGLVTNDGTIAVTSGRFNSTSTFTQSASGTLSLAITGTGPGDGGRFAGNDVTLAGNFDAEVGGGYAPQLGDTIAAMTYSSVTGTFASYTGFDLGGGLQFQQSFDADSMDLEVVSP
jgi:hypothetical protein